MITSTIWHIQASLRGHVPENLSFTTCQHRTWNCCWLRLCERTVRTCLHELLDQTWRQGRIELEMRFKRGRQAHLFSEIDPSSAVWGRVDKATCRHVLSKIHRFWWTNLELSVEDEEDATKEPGKKIPGLYLPIFSELFFFLEQPSTSFVVVNAVVFSYARDMLASNWVDPSELPIAACPHIIRRSTLSPSSSLLQSRAEEVEHHGKDLGRPRWDHDRPKKNCGEVGGLMNHTGEMIHTYGREKAGKIRRV